MAETNGENLTDIERKIIRQIEYYFGDVNLARDKFLQEQIKADDGWVAMEIMLKFNRLKILSDDNKVICEAIKKSKSGLMEVNETSTKIRRSPLKPLPENTRERRDDLNSRTMYVKGFSKESTLDELLAFFDKHGTMENLIMRRDFDKNFKGSVFAVFVKKEEFDNFLKAENIKYGDTELIKHSREDYLKSKAEEKRKLKEEQMKEKQEQQLKKMEEEKVPIVPGSILHLAEFTEDLERDDIKNFFSDHGKVAWVDYNSGDKEAWVRFDSENAAVEVLEKVKDSESGEIKIHGNVLKGDILEGEAEKEHWRKISLAKSASGRKNFKNKRNWKQNKNKRGRYRSDKVDGQECANSDDDAPAPAKVAKTEA